jgi:AAA15 family ATPase/GTPase
VLKVLLQFSFKNFKSFKDETTIDFTATKITEYSNHVVQVGNEKVLPIAAIYGANASGKSNVHEAFRYMSTYVVSSFAYGGDEHSAKGKLDFYGPSPFHFDADSQNAESSFEVHFIDSEENGAKTYNYGFTVDEDGINEEWLNYKSKSSRGDYRRIFYRKKDNDLDLPGIEAKSHKNIKIALEKETLVVSLGAKLKISKLRFIRDWFISNEFADFGRPIEDYFLSEQLPEGFVESKEVQAKVVEFFAAFDPSIIGFEVETLEHSEDSKQRYVRIDAIHKMVGTEKTASIPLKMESAGTLKMFALYPILHSVLSNGSVLFVDELNARLHPLLVRTFVVTFLNPEINKHNAQLVFTSHDSWQLNSNLLRRDEVWFTEKTNEGVSTLYSLADFKEDDGAKIRKDENHEKNYLLGKYGAIPYLRYFDMFEGE